MKGAQGFDGVVQFAFEVDHPSFGKVDVKSQFKRLRPDVERLHVTPEDLYKLKTILFNWVKKVIDIENHPRGVQYFEDLTTVNTRGSVYINPISELFGEPLTIFNKFMFWFWYCDDEVEAAVEKGIPIHCLQQASEQFCGVLKGNYDNGVLQYKDVPNYPQFRPVFELLLDLHKLCKLTLPNYQERVGPTRFYIRQYLDAMRWFCAAEKIDFRYSEITFQMWRGSLGFFDALTEAVALVEGVHVPINIRKSQSFMRLIDITNEFSSFVNDLLGMKKEFANGERDNLVIFKTLEKKIPLNQAVKEVCEHLNNKLGDFLLIKRAILKEFNNEPNLAAYIGIMESMIDGHKRFYMGSDRHRCAGQIQLIRENELQAIKA